MIGSTSSAVESLPETKLEPSSGGDMATSAYHMPDVCVTVHVLCALKAWVYSTQYYYDNESIINQMNCFFKIVMNFILIRGQRGDDVIALVSMDQC